MQRSVREVIVGRDSMDGAGVQLVSVLSRHTAEKLNPFLLLDSFDSFDYEDYKPGFPLHPHRGIETVTYINKGGITHKDSLGNEKRIEDGQVQWMGAGSGIMHSEFFEEEEHLQGVQIWINIPESRKMSDPFYKEPQPVVSEESFGVRKVFSEAGNSQSPHTPVDLQVLDIAAGKRAEIETDPEFVSYLFVIAGSVSIAGTPVGEKQLAYLTEGDMVEVEAAQDSVVLFIAAPRLDEPIAWNGPIVMNTQEELIRAFYELQNGTFVKKGL